MGGVPSTAGRRMAAPPIMGRWPEPRSGVTSSAPRRRTTTRRGTRSGRCTARVPRGNARPRPWSRSMWTPSIFRI